MVQEWRCDTWLIPGHEDEMIKIVDELKVLWHRHKECCEEYNNGKKFGNQPLFSI